MIYAAAFLFGVVVGQIVGGLTMLDDLRHGRGPFKL